MPWQWWRSNVDEVEASDAAAKLRAGEAQVVDVREPHEWLQEHVPGSRHIPLGELASRAHELSPKLPVFTLCASGRRSKVAAEILQRAGHQRVASVRGGIKAWRAGGHPVVSGR